jgi:hypothetical protein
MCDKQQSLHEYEGILSPHLKGVSRQASQDMKVQKVVQPSGTMRFISGWVTIAGIMLVVLAGV